MEVKPNKESLSDYFHVLLFYYRAFSIEHSSIIWILISLHSFNPPKKRSSKIIIILLHVILCDEQLVFNSVIYETHYLNWCLQEIAKVKEYYRKVQEPGVSEQMGQPCSNSWNLMQHSHSTKFIEYHHSRYVPSLESLLSWLILFFRDQLDFELLQMREHIIASKYPCFML